VSIGRRPLQPRADVKSSRCCSQMLDGHLGICESTHHAGYVELKEMQRRVPVHSMFGHTSIYGDTYQQRFVSFSPVKPSLPAISMVIKSLTTDYPVKSIDLDMWTPEQMEVGR
jgi:hypothetical protein